MKTPESQSAVPSESQDASPFMQFLKTVRQLLSNVWLAGLFGGILAVIIFAIVGLVTPNGVVEAIGVTNHNVLRGISLVIIIPAVSLSMGYFAARPSGWRSQLKVIAVAGLCYIVASFLLGWIEMSRMDAAETTMYPSFYIGQTFLGLLLLPILSVPAANGQWRTYVMVVLLPLIIAWFFIRLAMRFAGIPSGSTGGGGMSDDERQRRQYQQIHDEQNR